MTEEQHPSTGTVRIDNELLDMARVVVALRRAEGGKPSKIGEYLEAILRPVITKDHAAALARVQSPKGRRPKESGQ